MPRHSRTAPGQSSVDDLSTVTKIHPLLLRSDIYFNPMYWTVRTIPMRPNFWKFVAFHCFQARFTRPQPAGILLRLRHRRIADLTF